MSGVFLVMLIANIVRGGQPLPLILLASYFAAVLVGGFLGFIVADIRLVATLFDHDGMKHLPILKWGSSKRKIKNTMLRYDKNFLLTNLKDSLFHLCVWRY